MSLLSLLQPVLLPLSWLYAIGARLDARRRARRAFRSALPVISVGNIGSGGSGKTPLVQLLVERLQSDAPVLVLSRGYGRNGTEQVVWRVGEPAPDPETFGDEPALLARSMRRGAIAVGRDRGALLEALEEAFAGAIVILDDGFQHRQLARDVDIVIVDAPTARSPYRLLPAGRLRELPAALGRADFVIATSLSARSLAAKYCPPDRIFDAGIAARRVRSVSTGEPLRHGTPVVLVTGIARPERALQTLLELGMSVERHVSFPDHHRYPRTSLAKIERALSEHAGAALVTTLKDAVKLERVAAFSGRLHVVDVALRINDEERFLRALHERLAHTGRREQRSTEYASTGTRDHERDDRTIEG